MLLLLLLLVKKRSFMVPLLVRWEWMSECACEFCYSFHINWCCLVVFLVCIFVFILFYVFVVVVAVAGFTSHFYRPNWMFARKGLFFFLLSISRLFWFLLWIFSSVLFEFFFSFGFSAWMLLPKILLEFVSKQVWFFFNILLFLFFFLSFVLSLAVLILVVAGFVVAVVVVCCFSKQSTLLILIVSWKPFVGYKLSRFIDNCWQCPRTRTSWMKYK